MLHYLEHALPPPPGTSPHHAVPGRPAAEAVAAEVRRLGGEATLVEADLADPGAAARIFDHAGRVDALVNNAAHCETPDTIAAITGGTIDRHFAVNTRAPVLLIAEFGRHHRAASAGWGRIINVSTDCATIFPTEISYGASKAALEAFTRSLAVELGPLGITVNAVAPGPVQTGYITPAMEERLMPAIPLRRIGTPEDIADVIVFLASEQARWLTGQVIQVAGGHELR